jgi:peptidoglycan/xylan/chitin deacetylase (PgdA/CDA1 family)
MICLTGDIHHMSLGINDQAFIPEAGDTEAAIAGRFLKLVESRGLKVTFYVTGMTLEQEWPAIAPIAQSPLVEIGGHTYAGLPRPPGARIRSLLTGRRSVSHAATHGSAAAQERDVRRMIEVAQRRTGRRIVSWRSHGLVVDAHTYPILASNGIRFVSDELAWSKMLPERTAEGLVSHPMNVLMDHDHIYHAHRTPQYVEQQKQAGGGYPGDPDRESYSVGEWAGIVRGQVAEIESRGGLATVLMHPLCMYLADRFAAAERLLDAFSRSTSIWASETGRLLGEG